MLWTVWRIRRGMPALPWKDPVLTTGSILIFLGLIQLVPLPRPALEKISPKAVELRERFEPAAAQQASASGGRWADADSWRSISLHPWGTRQATLRVVAFFLVLLITLDLAGIRSARSVLLTGLIGSGAFQAIYGLAEFFSERQHIFGYAKRYYTNVATGTFINRNHFAGYLEMTLPLAIAAAAAALVGLRAARGSNLGQRVARMTGREMFHASGLLVVSLVMATALLSSRSRMGIASMMMAFLTIGLLLWWRGRGRRYAVAAMLVAGATLFIFAQGDSTSAILGRFQNSMNDLGGDLGRWEIWTQTGRMALEFPLLGVGLGAFPSVFPLFRTTGAGSFVTHAHSDYMEFFAEVGLLGCMALLLCAALVTRTILSCKAIRPDFGDLGYACMTGIAAIGFHSFTDFNLAVPSNALTLAVLIALGLSWMRIPAPALAVGAAIGQPRTWIPKALVPAGVLAGIALIAVAPVTASAGDNDQDPTMSPREERGILAGFIDGDNADRLFAAARRAAGPAVEDFQVLVQMAAQGVEPSADAIALVELRLENAIALQARGLRALPTSSKGHLQMGQFLLGRCAARGLRADPAAECMAGAIVEIRKAVELAPMSAARHADAARLLIAIWPTLDARQQHDLRPVLVRALKLNARDSSLQRDGAAAIGEASGGPARVP
jgi:O-antigen ligase